MAALALLSAVGAWMAWKRNPTYSAATTVRTVLVMAVLIAGLVAAIGLAVHLTEKSSETVSLAAIFGVVIVGTLVMIFGIMAVSTPKEAKLVTALPPTAKLSHFHRQKVYLWAKIIAGIVAVCAVVGLLVPGPVKYVGLTLGGITLYLAVILLPVLYVTTRNFDRSLTALQYDPWVHWTYPPAQWQEWSNVQADRAKDVPPTFIWRRDWKKLAWPFAAIAVGVMYFSPAPKWASALYVVFVCGALAALANWSATSAKRMPDKIRAKLLASAPEVYFGHDGIFCDSAYTTWLSVNVYLMSASIDERPPRSLLFNFEKVIPGAYSGNSIVTVHQSVLIPPNAEADIARLQRELVARCPKARIALA
jgi:hypothetical protein